MQRLLLTIEYGGDGVGEIHLDEEHGKPPVDRLFKLLRHKEHDQPVTRHGRGGSPPSRRTARPIPCVC